VAQVTMESFARKQLSKLVDNLVQELHKAAKRQSAEAVHKIRVSIRRLVQGLRVFRQYVPAAESKKLRKQLRRVMKLSSTVRDHDIALQYLTKHGHQPEEIITARLKRKHELIDMVKTVSRPDLSREWRLQLGLDAE
jgi:CHAD domain-containing protein